MMIHTHHEVHRQHGVSRSCHAEARVSRLAENTRCLKHLCRLKIRDCLGKLRLRAPIFMNFLPLPKSLKHYVQYREYDLYGLGTLKDPR